VTGRALLRPPRSVATDSAVFDTRNALNRRMLSFELYWQPPDYGTISSRPSSFVYMGEPVVYLTAAGIRVKLRPIERAALQKEGPDGNGSFGNAATKSDPGDRRGHLRLLRRCRHRRLFQEQGAELDRRKREARLHRIQQLIFDKVAVAPIVHKSR
jgi:hypothetical protein